jgi:hypothetical protein
MRPFLFLTLFVFAGSLATVRGQSATKVAEMESLRESYERKLEANRAARDQRAKNVIRSYMGGLETLRKEAAASGDLDGTLAVKSEQERVSKGTEPSDEQKRAFPGKLLALRLAFERERAPFHEAAEKERAEVLAKYGAALDELQQRLTKANQLDKALAVKAAREKIARGETGGAPGMNAGASAMSVPTGNLKLEAGLATKIKSAITSNAIQNANSAKSAGGDREVPPDGALLIGFEISDMGWKGEAAVKALTPIYLGSDGVFTGAVRGKHPPKTVRVEARKGYAVGGLMVLPGERLMGLQIVFMKIDPGTGKLDTSAQGSYTSKWFGSEGKRKDAPVRVGGDGYLMIGVHGRSGNDADSIGLVMVP